MKAKTTQNTKRKQMKKEVSKINEQIGRQGDKPSVESNSEQPHNNKKPDFPLLDKRIEDLKKDDFRP